MTHSAFHGGREGFLHRLNPLTKLTAAGTLAAAAFLLPEAWWNFPLWFLALLPLAVAGRLARPFLKTVAAMYLPFAGFLFLIHGLFHPASEDELFRLWIFSVQSGPLLYAAGVAGRVLVMLSAFTLLFLSTHPGRLMQDLQRRGLHWALAYVVTATLQFLPLVRERARTILQAQQARGLDTGGSLGNRIRALLPLLGPLFHGVLMEVEDRALALETRGVMRSGPRQFLTRIEDPAPEKAARWFCLACLLLLILWRGGRAWL
ncbi:energy-coupling factor transporter transmembrane component T family protein [Salidesulfovibrio onnuriiensis]|uniref:energy-coupling factor transporter transmembrane component T family protein n=1 Tax=Salidesulfovibrio onnuriiensis TaxID=2583823 RepID=UPI0011CC8994|nr:energy-coupling factor transporter transmembrane component T [Salidesulfovibrio onnuriiensis]